MRSWVKMFKEALLIALVIATIVTIAFIGGVAFTSGVELALKHHGVQVVLIKVEE